MIKCAGLTCFFITSCMFACAQKLPNTLLWRISGNGLQKPSYLYGTMHLTDQRLFNLGDSLYKAIENTEGFAIEVNPDEMTAVMIDEINKEFKNARFIKDVLNKREFKQYGAALAKKIKKPADEITTRDIFMEKNKWVKESFQKGEMSTFLDAYLFDIARRQGKWTGGVEDIDDQKDLLNGLVDESDIRQIATDDEAGHYGHIPSFITLYLSSNLNAIDSITNASDSGFIDNLLTKRNRKMARRIDSLTRLRTMVFAVGAAHLPGKKGLISLLRNAGYELKPVFSSKKIRPADYKVKETDIPWIAVTDPEGYYKVNMPGTPGDIEMFGLLKMKMNFDIFNSTGYLTTAAVTPYGQKGIDSIMNFLTVKLFKQNTPQKAKNITINGVEGKELESTDEEGYKHGYILYKNHIIYLAMGVAVKKNSTSESALNKFLSSFQVFEKKDYKSQVYTYSDSAHLFTVDLPSKPQSGNGLVNYGKKTSVNSNLMISFDNQTGAYYLVGVNQTAPGYFIEDDSSTLRNIEKELKAKFSKMELDTIYNKYPNRILEIQGKMINPDVFARSYYAFTGNRWYALLVMYDNSKSNPMADRFFESFRILSSPAPEWKQQSSADGAITTWAPGNIKYYEKDSSDYLSLQKYETYDSIRGNNYDIIVSYPGKYYWQESDSSLWSTVIKNEKGYNDSLLSQRFVTNGDIKGIELELRQNSSFNIKRKRILLYGDTLYTLLAIQPEQEINSINTNKFFDDFRFNNPAPPSTIFRSKAIRAVNDLSAGDSATRAEARNALFGANFGVNDLTLLYQALLNTYPYDKDDYNSINGELSRVIMNIKDSSSLRIAKEKYAITHDNKIKSLLLDIMSEYKTKENFDDIRDMLLQSHPDTALSYSFVNNVKDSAALAADLVRGILPLIKDTFIAPAIISICADLVDSNIISIRELNPYFDDIEAFGDRAYKKLKQDDDDYGYNSRFILRVISKFNNLKSNTILQKWLTIHNNYLKLICIEALLQNRQPVPAPPLLAIAKDKTSRIDLYTSLKKQNKLALFPKQYLTQQYFAESYVYAAASDDTEPLAITYVTQKNVTSRGKKVRFFFYKVTYGEDEDKSQTLACAGPFDLDPLKLSEDDAYGSLYFTEDFDQANLPKQIKALLKQVEEEE